MQLISRQDAKARGLKHYYTGKPCTHGHKGRRYVGSGACAPCAVIHSTAQNKKQTTEQRRANWKKYYDRHPERARESARRAGWKRDGMPTPTRDRPLTCEACNEPPKKRALALDHDHASGAFRGWLCDRCNFAIGLLFDDPRKIQGLLSYLLRAP